jgi:hypothetical protein
VSFDYGASWSEEENLTTYYSLDWNVDPTITKLSNGSLLVVWSAVKNPPLQDSDFEMSASPENITIPQGENGTSTITVTSLNGFNDTVNLNVKLIMPPSPHINASLDPTQVTPPPNGNANSTLTIIVGSEANATQYFITVTGTSETENITHDVTVNLNVTEGGSSSFSINDLGYTAPVSKASSNIENYDLYYKVSHDNGSSWSDEVKLTEDLAPDLAPCVLQASNGTLWLVWASNRVGGNNSEIFFKTSSDLGVSWSNATRLTFDNNTDTRPAVAEIQNGSIMVAWHSFRYGNEEILYKIYNGSSWSEDIRLTNHTNMDTSPAILQLSNGTLLIFWASSGTTEDDTYDIYYKKSNDNGQTWSERIQFTTHSAEDLWPAVTQSVDKRIWVLWTTNRTGSWNIYYRTSFVHNVAVSDVVLSQSTVYQEENLSIEATVWNYGDYNETSTVACYINSTLLDSQTISLNATAAEIVVFTWNTSGVARGNYLIKVNVSEVDGEYYLGDNTLATIVRVKMLGDVDDNGLVNVADVFMLAKAYGSGSGDPNWNEEADMNGDDLVDSVDLFALSGNYGGTG